MLRLNVDMKSSDADLSIGDVTVEVQTAVFTDRLVLAMLGGFAAAACAAGAVEQDQADTWLAEQARRAEMDRLFLAVPLFIAVGVVARCER